MADATTALDDLFSTFEHSAWRLEVRASYGLTAEDRPFQQFLANQPVDLAWFEPWLTLMRDQIGKGKRVERVRVIDQPPSDYLRWEHWLNQFNKSAGEDIRYLPRDVADSLALPSYDFWLFDGGRVAFMQFNEDGEFVGPVVVEDQAVTRQHVAFSEAAWRHAVPYERYSV
jgi:hypothetical protein